MSNRNATLLWNRRKIPLPAGRSGTQGIIPSVTDVDTGLQQPNRGFENSSGSEPQLAPRVEVVPLAPTGTWSGVTHGEPFVDPGTDTVHVLFLNGTLSVKELNVLFWDPHTAIGPGQVDPYGMVQGP